MNKILSRENKGITLISLVITIIVLLILAAVSIGMLFGENGILTQAEEAREEHRAGSVEEQRDLWLLEQNIKIQTNDDTMEIESIEAIANRLRDENKLLESQAEVDSIINQGYVIIADRKIDFYYLTSGDTGTGGTGNPEDDVVSPGEFDTIKVGDYVEMDTIWSNPTMYVVYEINSENITIIPVQDENDYREEEQRFEYEDGIYFEGSSGTTTPNFADDITAIKEAKYEPAFEDSNANYMPAVSEKFTLESVIEKLKINTEISDLGISTEYTSDDFTDPGTYNALKAIVGNKKVVLDKFEILQNYGSNKEWIWNIYTLENVNGKLVLSKEEVFNINFEVSGEYGNEDGSNYYLFDKTYNALNTITGILPRKMETYTYAIDQNEDSDKGINFGTEEKPWYVNYINQIA